VRRGSRSAAAALGALLCALPALPSWSQVQIVRELPQTGENQAQAQWGPPLPTAQAVVAGRPTQFGGRISAGGSGGINDSGTQTLDAFLESNLSLLVPFGSSSSFQLTGDAARRPGLDGLDQAYKSIARLTMDALQVEAGGSFHQQARNEATGSTAELGGDAHASVTTVVIPTLPLSASYSFSHVTQNQSDFTGAFAQITDAVTHQGQLKGTGTIGSVGVDTGANFSSVTDYAQNMQSTVFGGNVGVTVPVVPSLKVFATFLPKYNAVSYSQTGNSVTNTSLESDAGFLIPISEPLSFKIGGGRIDQWSSQSGPSAYTDPSVPSSSVTWKGLTGLELKEGSSLSASATYGFGKVVSGPFVQSLDALFGYNGQNDSFVKNAAAGGDYTLSLDDSGGVVDSQATWNTSAAVGSQDAFAMTASYSGSADGIAQTALTNAAHVGISHQLIPALSYALGADLSQSEGPNIQPTFLQTYQGKVIVAPRLGDRVVTFTTDEIVALDVLLSPVLVVSKAGTGVAVPLFSILTTRYRFDWEWDSATAPGSGAGSNYRNAVGLTLGGQSLPFSLTTEYALSFGFRGLRHDDTSSITATLWQGFTLQGSLVLSAYDAGAGTIYPFLVTVSGAYSF
jgi:hypothetical protein